VGNNLKERINICINPIIRQNFDKRISKDFILTGKKQSRSSLIEKFCKDYSEKESDGIEKTPPQPNTTKSQNSAQVIFDG